MPPNPYQNQPGDPVSLPPVPASAAGQPQLSAALGQTQQPVGSVDLTGRVIAEAKRIAIQYRNDPYQLSEALSKLKSSYLAEHNHINTSGSSMEQ